MDDSYMNLRSIKIWEWIFAILLILDGNSVWHAASYTDYNFDILCSFSAFMLFWTTQRYRSICKVKNIIPILFAILGFYFVMKFQMVAKKPFVYMFIIALPCLLKYFIKAINNNHYKLLFNIQNIIIVISIISLFFWIFGSTMHNIAPNCQIVVEWGGTRNYEGYYNIYYEAQDNMRIPFTDIIACRNCAIFTEGPMFNLWISISLFIEFFVREKISLYRLGILLSALLTTFSTTGYIFLMLLVIMWTYRSTLSIRSKTKKMIYTGSIVFIAFFCFIAYESLMEDKSETISYITRMNDYEEALELWKQNKIAGYGYGNVKYLFNLSGRDELGFSNSLLAILATGGLYITFIFLCPVVYLMSKVTNNKYRISPVLAISFMYWSFTTIFFLRILMVFFLALLIAYSCVYRDDSYLIEDNL